ncbi:MAG: helix-turn-helix domain-containing protein [Gemmataceae bacterium]
MAQPRQRGRPRKPRPTNLSGQLGERVELLRKKRNLPADDLGTLAGLGLGTVIRVERGEQSPTLDTVLAIAHALEMSGADLLATCSAWMDKPKGR